MLLREELRAASCEARQALAANSHTPAAGINDPCCPLQQRVSVVAASLEQHEGDAAALGSVVVYADGVLGVSQRWGRRDVQRDGR